MSDKSTDADVALAAELKELAQEIADALKDTADEAGGRGEVSMSDTRGTRVPNLKEGSS